MRGIEDWNFPAFEAAEQDLLSQGIDVVSPHRIDLEDGFNPFNGDEPPCVEEVIQRDIDAIYDVDALVFLTGWESSKGARAEKSIAEWMEKPCFLYPSLDPI